VSRACPFFWEWNMNEEGGGGKVLIWWFPFWGFVEREKNISEAVLAVKPGRGEVDLDLDIDIDLDSAGQEPRQDQDQKQNQIESKRQTGRWGWIKTVLLILPGVLLGWLCESCPRVIVSILRKRQSR
jgi:hypothetical protein